MTATGETVAAATTDYMALPRDNLPGMKVIDVGTHIDNLANKLMTHDHGHRNGCLSPIVPVVDMHVGAADGSAFDFDQDVVDTHFWFRHIFQPEADASVPFN
jgi:hypothetical protein